MSGRAPAPPPHAPRTGLMRRILGSFHVTGVFWYRLHLFGVSILPEWGMRALMPLFTTSFFLFLFNIRRAVASNLEAVLGPCGWWERQKRIYKTLWEFSWCLSERYEAVGSDRRVRCEIDGRDHWDALTAADEGFVLLTAHVGNWEVGSSIPSQKAARPVHLVREMEMDPEAQKFVERIIRERGFEGLEVHFAGPHDPSLGLELLAALRRGEIVALQGDRPRTGERPLAATLFGRPMQFPTGPVALARAAGVPILPVFVFREGRLRSRLVLREPIRVATTSDRARDFEEAVGTIASNLEWAIRRAPHQWFCFRELWPD